MTGEPRPPLTREQVGELDALAMRLKNEISVAGGVEAIDLAYRILISCIADQIRGGDNAREVNAREVARTLRTSSDAVALLLERLPGGKLTPIRRH